MTKAHQLIQQNKASIITYLSVAAVVLALTAIGHLPARDFYQRFLNDISPLVIIPATILLGFVCLVVLSLRGWFAVMVAGDDRRVLPAFVFAVIPPLVAIVIDLFVHFPKGINQSFPGSLAFYPSIGFLVEVVFHLVPITILYLLLGLFFPNSKEAAVVRSVLLLVAFIEPSFQMVLMASGEYPLMGLLAVFVNLLIFNGTQLVLFRRSGFLAMYGSRFLYYLIWHIIWGHFRLAIIFK
jgi:hypothetical protein